jgi:hypothetical protein
MDWVNSGGGPLICAEEHVATQWLGVQGRSAGSDSVHRNDYERACDTQEYLEAVLLNMGSALVLGDEPLQSAFFTTKSDDLAIARWIYARTNNDDDIESFLSGTIAFVSTIALAISFEVKRGGLVLFDSALSGQQATACSRKADIRPGPYTVTTESFRMEGEFSFVVHRFLATAN